MRAAYSEMLRRIQQEGLYQAEEQQRWRAGQLAGRRLKPPDSAPEDAPGGQPPETSGTGPKEERPQETRQPRAGRGWTSEDVVECWGCWYWRMLDYTLGIRACWYPLLEDRLRPCLPADCYRKPGTPYRPCDRQEPEKGAGQGAAEKQNEQEGMN